MAEFKVKAREISDSINLNEIESRLRAHAHIKDDRKIRKYLYRLENLTGELDRFISTRNELISQISNWKQYLRRFSEVYEGIRISEATLDLDIQITALRRSSTYLRLAMPLPVEKGKSTFLKMIISYDNYFRIRFKQAS